MKNNVIFFFVDSVTWNYVGKNRAYVSPTPFLDSLRSESLVTTKLYSYAPYTDAATRSLFTGRNCLDDYGYFFRTNTSPINHYKAFHDLGYETYDFNYPFYIIGDKQNENIDHRCYNSSFYFPSEWGGVYKYYSEISRERQLSDIEYSLLEKRLCLMFESWIRYMRDMLSEPEASLMHKKVCECYDAEKSLDTLEKECESCKMNPRSYIDKLLSEAESHVLFTIDPSTVSVYIDAEFLNGYVVKKYSSLFKKIKKNNFKANAFRNIPGIKRTYRGIKRYLKTKDSSNLMFWQNYVGSLFPCELMQKRWGEKTWQNNHPARTVYGTALGFLKSRKSDTPFYFYLNAEEPHNNIAFFSYDTQDKEVIDEEMRMLEDYVDQLGTNFRGNLIYLLSIRYTDYCIERFCKSLKELGLWNATTILFVADHGSSYTYWPLHNNRVNCFDDECYHIPMLIRHPGLKGSVIKTYQQSKDVLPTLMDIMGLPIPSDFKGQSMLRETKPREYVVSEYMGPGCPDMMNRRIWFSVRDKNYIVAYKVSIKEDFEDGELAEVYDLINDPNAYYNICDSINISEISYLLNSIEERWKEIKKDVDEFISNFEKKINEY